MIAATLSACAIALAAYDARSAEYDDLAVRYITAAAIDAELAPRGFALWAPSERELDAAYSRLIHAAALANQECRK